MEPAKFRKYSRTGQRHHNAEYTDREIELVRQLYADGMRQVEIARRMEMAKSTVSMIVRFLRR